MVNLRLPKCRMTDNLGAFLFCHQWLQTLLTLMHSLSLCGSYAHTSVGLCVQMQVHIGLRPVDDGAELEGPLTLHLHPTYYVDSATVSHLPWEEIACVHIV